MEKLKIDDLLNYKFLSELTASPSGEKAAFVVKQADRKKKGYDSWIYIVDFCTEEVRKLTSFGAEKNILFDDEDTLLFASARCQEDQADKFGEKTVFYRISLKGGEAWRAFEIPFAVEKMKKISQGVYGFTATVDLNRPKSAEELEEYEDYHILEELPYWENGAYFVSRFRRSLFVFHEEQERFSQVSEPLFGVNDFTPWRDSLIYTGASYDRVLPRTGSIMRYDLKDGTTHGLVEPGHLRIGLFDCTGEEKEGLRVYFAGSIVEEEGSGRNPDLYVWEKGAWRKEASYGYSVGSATAGDISLGGGSKFLAEGDQVYFTSCRRTKAPVCVLNGGKTGELFEFDGSVDCFAKTAQGMVLVGRTPGKLQELYVYDEERGECRQISRINEEPLREKYIGELHYAGFKNSDGVEIDGWVILPKDYDPAKRYPAILDMHGGPRVAFGETLFHEMQVFANEGYFVFLCNPRGSDGRGDEFADLKKKYGTIDFKDFMEFTDHVCKLYPAINENRLGVTGGSYGGWMTNWIIGHTHRFHAAVSQRSFSNWLSDFGCSEIGFSFDVGENGGQTPWTAQEELWERSPLAYACNAKTPTLFIHSLKDYNCPLSEGMQMFAALKYFNVPSKAFLFEGESHELSRSGKPVHRIRRIKEMLGWFDSYLKEDKE